MVCGRRRIGSIVKPLKSFLPGAGAPALRALGRLAPVSIGGVAIGLVSLGGYAAGVLALSGFAIGVWSFGGLAVGWQSFAECAIAWQAAVGGAAIAHDFALGGVAAAAGQANNEVAAVFVRTSPFFKMTQALFPYLAWLNLIWVIPMLLWWQVVRRGGQNDPRQAAMRRLP